MGNCTSHASRRYPSPKKHLGLFETALGESRLVCEVIADDRHVPDALFDIFYRLKGKDGICFVSDSLSVAGMKEGDYFLGSGESAQPIRIEDGVAVLPDKHTYAGSVTPVSKMVSRLFAKGYPAEDLLTMATLTPAKTVGLNDRGDLRPGMLADINLLDDKLNVVKTFMF